MPILVMSLRFSRSEDRMKQIQIAIDGPASSGKSTVAKIIAKDLRLYLSRHRAMYRKQRLT